LPFFYRNVCRDFSGPDSIVEPVQTLEISMNPKLIVAVFVIAAVPVYAQAQKPSTAKVTTADVQKVVTLISGDKAKTQTYCDIGKLNEQIEEANEKKDIKKTEELSQQIDALGKKLGPEYAALMDGLQEVDPESEDGKKIGLMFEPLDRLCAK
jgi:mevalonate kinase